MSASIATASMPVDLAASAAKDHDLVVAIDLGTSGTGVCMAFCTEEMFKDPAAALDSLIFLKPGEPGARTDKQFTALLLNPATELALIQFGEAAQKEFVQRYDREDSKPALYFHTFKMALEPSPSRPRDVEGIILPAAGVIPTHHNETTAAPHPTVPLMLLMQRVLEFVKSDVDRYLASRIGSAVDVNKLRVLWVLTVPAIWDDEGKYFMRMAAFRAGIIKEVASPHLILALEPECAVLGALADATPAQRAGFERGATVMIVDCGGGTVDITSEEIESTHPLSLREIAAASGGPWGGVNVDKTFVVFIRSLLGDDLWAEVDSAIQLELLQDWQTAKRNVPVEEKETGKIHVPLTGIFMCLEEKVGMTKKELRQIVEDFNVKYGWREETALDVTRANKLLIPCTLARSFFVPVFNKISTHITTLLDNLESEGKRIDMMVLAGGFAESPFLQSHLRKQLEARCKRIFLPARPSVVVNAGAVLFALQPKPIGSRKMRWSYGYVGAELFNPEVHDERHKVTIGGRALCKVIFPIVHEGQDVEPGFTFQKSGLLPVSPDQHIIDFDIFRTHAKIVNGKVDRSAPRSVPLIDPTNSGKNIGIPLTDKIATLQAHIGACSTPLHDDRKVTLSLVFGSTEITAKAAVTTAAGSSESAVSMRYA